MSNLNDQDKTEEVPVDKKKEVENEESIEDKLKNTEDKL